MKRVFEKRYGKIISPDQARDRVEQINRESKVLTFAAKKVIEVSFRGQVIHLVDGTISYPALGYRGSTTSRSESCLFVIFSNERTDFFTEHHDVFRKGFAGKKDSVFFVDPLKILTELRTQP